MKISYFSFLCSHHPPSSPTTDDSLGRDAYQSGDDDLNDNNDKRCKSDSDIYIYIYPLIAKLDEVLRSVAFSESSR